MPRIYIAGPMTGLPELNYPAFHARAAELRAQGHDVLNPAENPAPPCGTWAGYMRMALAQLVTCDTIDLLPGWRESKGANVEAWLAGLLGLKVQPEALADAAMSGAQGWVLEDVTNRLQSLAALKKRADSMPVMHEIQWLTSLRNRMLAAGRLVAEPETGFNAAIERPPFDFIAHLHRQAEFSARTFGPGKRVAGITDHIKKELREVIDSGGDLSEWVDVVILGLEGAWRSGATPEQIVAAIVAKQTKNESRTWPDWRTAPAGQAIEHVRGPHEGQVPA